MKATMCERTFALGRSRYKVDTNGNWLCLLWGWFPGNNGTPVYRWSPIPKDKIPKEVLEESIN